MKEKIYAIPVNDAFNSDCECPVCKMYKTLEDNAVEYTMGPSYMEDDIRMQTDKAGFCAKHMQMIYTSGNKLGISLILKTHFDKIIRDTASLPAKSGEKKGLKNIFGVTEENFPLAGYLEELNRSCFVCDRINNVFDRYIDTVFYLYRSDDSFRAKFHSCRGFCNSHFLLLIKKAPEYLKGAALDEFTDTAKDLYIKNMERVRDDLAWFIDKFDYRNNDAPWKNSKDSIPRAIIKTNSLIQEEP